MKEISFITSGNRADIGPIEIYRILPNRYAQAVGHFVFLDHLAPKIVEETFSGTTGPHPHRGIATLTYVMSGEGHHADSAGNKATVLSGGVQWMKAGNGIVHDEVLLPTSHSRLIHGFQFWINLPSKIKKEKPDYLAMAAEDVPTALLPDESGMMKVILGRYENLESPIPVFAPTFLYHLSIQPNKTVSLYFKEGMEVAAFLPTHSLTINQKSAGSGDFVEFDRKEGEVILYNAQSNAADVLIFGGSLYEEPIVAEGPFVMNSKAEIAEAYRDYFAGKYGTIG